VEICRIGVDEGITAVNVGVDTFGVVVGMSTCGIDVEVDIGVSANAAAAGTGVEVGLAFTTCSGMATVGVDGSIACMIRLM
jgi:hypothetical protein